MSWYKQGQEGIDGLTRDEEERQRKQGDSPEGIKDRRFWIPPNKTTRITFLSNEIFFIKEHQVYMNGSWRNFYTCSGEQDSCYFCESGVAASYLCIFTILDHSEYTSKKGDRVTVSKRLLCVKGDTRKKVLRLRERHGDLTGCQFDVTRLSAKDVSTGSDYDFLRKLSPAELQGLVPQGQQAAEFLRPYNLIEIFRPIPYEEQRRKMGQAPPVGSGGDNPAGSNGSAGGQDLSGLI